MIHPCSPPYWQAPDECSEFSAGDLTPGQRDCMLLAACGLANREIGRRLHLSRQTVKNHLSVAFARTGAQSRYELIVLVLGRGWLDVAGLPLGRALSAGDLTPPQRGCMLLAACGLMNKEIGRALGITNQTVKNHMTFLLARTGARDRFELTILVFRRRWLDVHQLLVQRIEPQLAESRRLNRELGIIG